MGADTPAAILEALLRFYSDGEFDDSPVVDTVRRLTGREPRRFEAWARDHAAAFNGSG